MSAPKKVRWGILGAANINQKVLPEMAKADNAEILAIASRSKKKAGQVASDWDIPRAHGSYDDLLNDPDVDAVYIPLPNTLHDQWTRKAAEAGKHILCEKPLCPSADEAQALVDYCHEKGVKLMDGFMWPHHPRTAEIRKLLDDGAIGEVVHVNSCFSFNMDPLNPSNIRLKPEMAGGSLLDIGCYPVYGIRWAMGAEPVRVHAFAKYAHGVDVEMSAVLEFKDGRSANFDCAFTMPFRGWIEIVGTKGSIYVCRLWQPTDKADYVLQQGDREPEKKVVEGESQIMHMVRNFGRFVLEDKPVRPSPDEAVRSARVMDALLKSAKEGTAVSL